MNIRDEMAEDALKFVGYPSMRYKHPFIGLDESGFDCSGFISFLLKRRDLYIGSRRHTNEFFDSFGVFIHSEALDRGDLVFFSWDGYVPRHIGVMISKDKYIHAPGRDNTVVEIDTLKMTEICSPNPGQIYFHNPIGFKRLAKKRFRYHEF